MRLDRDTIKKLMGLITFAVLLFVGLQNTRLFAAALRAIVGLVAPFLIGGCIAFVLNVPMRFFEDRVFSDPKLGRTRSLRKVRRALSLILTIVVVVGVIAVVLFMVVPELYQSFAAIGRELSQAMIRFPRFLAEIARELPMFASEIESLRESFLDVDWRSIGLMVRDLLQHSNVLRSTMSFASSVVSGVSNAVIGIVFAIYILLQKEDLGRQFRRLLYAMFPEKHVDRLLDVCALTSASFNSFLSGQCMEAFILGMMFFVSMLILHMPYALVIAVLIGVTALIPIFGAFIGCIVGAFLILIASPMQAVWFIVLFLVLQQIEGNIIYPRVVGSSVGLPSIWVLVAVTLGASVAGVLGILFAIPTVSVVYTLLRRYVRDRIEARGIAADKIR
ncbi:MAG: AI-2E family transporter [Eubacteriales bacterium]|nr:AI-2E family transporter [Eubacteriales bacterium]